MDKLLLYILIFKIYVCYSLFNLKKVGDSNFFDIDITFYNNEQIFANILLDNNTYNVLLDTGSNIFWVNSKNGIIPQTDEIHSLKYKSGYVEFLYTFGLLSINQGKSFINIKYGVSITTKSRVFNNSIVNGILGLGIDSELIKNLNSLFLFIYQRN